MLITEPNQLIASLNATCKRAFERAAGTCFTSRHYELSVEHVIYACLKSPRVTS